MGLIPPAQTRKRKEETKMKKLAKITALSTLIVLCLCGLTL